VSLNELRLSLKLAQKSFLNYCLRQQASKLFAPKKQSQQLAAMLPSQPILLALSPLPLHLGIHQFETGRIITSLGPQNKMITLV
jgi:hypothetical protein